MSLTPLEADLNVHQGLPDRPNANEGLTAAELKVLFDQAPNAIKTYINSVLLAELQAVTGAGNIGATAPSGLSGATVQALLVALKNNIDSVNPVAGFFNVKDPQYGAVGDGVTDDTTAIQAAIDACPSGGIVFFPIGDFLLQGTDTELLLITKPIWLIGVGYYSRLFIDSTVPNTTDVIRISPLTAFRKEQVVYSGFSIIPKAGKPARYGFHLDVTDVGQYISKLTISNVMVEPLGAQAVWLTNPTNQDGFFTSVIRDNLFYGGTYFERIGDSVYFERNTITGDNVGIHFSSVSGAAQVVIEKNNITCAGGAVRVDNGDQVKICHNQFEQPVAYTGSVDAMVYVEDTVMPEIIGNNLNSSNNVPHNIVVENTFRAVIENNVMYKGTAEQIRVKSGANKTKISYHNYYFDTVGELAPSILDEGIGTMGVFKTITPLAGWIDIDSANFFSFSWRKNEDGLVTLFGNLSAGTTTSGTNIGLLPIGARPQKAIRIPLTNGTLVVDQIGNITIESLSSATIYLDGKSFQANY